MYISLTIKCFKWLYIILVMKKRIFKTIGHIWVLFGNMVSQSNIHSYSVTHTLLSWCNLIVKIKPHVPQLLYSHLRNPSCIHSQQTLIPGFLRFCQSGALPVIPHRPKPTSFLPAAGLLAIPPHSINRAAVNSEDLVQDLSIQTNTKC